MSEIVEKSLVWLCSKYTRLDLIWMEDVYYVRTTKCILVWNGYFYPWNAAGLQTFVSFVSFTQEQMGLH